jgi:threonine-phosphate decarboxylase
MGLTFPKEYIDFSANINPLGPPDELKEKWNEFYQEISVYPDPFATQLKGKIAKKEQISVDSILIGNGGAELITLVSRMLAGKKVLMVQPTFSEYEKACQANKCEIQYYQLEEPNFELNSAVLCLSLVDVDAVFLCNPNNPTGIQYPTSTILSIIEEGERHNCLIILDEAFYDFLVDYDSFIPYINRFSNLIIIRSMTKMFALPGIRLGYLVAQPAVIAEINQHQSHWSINTIALLAGELCLQDQSFIKKTQDYICLERKRLFDFFKQKEFITSSSKVNFYLLRDPYIKDQLEFFAFLLDKGIIPRHTFNFKGLEGKWLRFAIKGYEENTQLMEVVTEWRQYHH